MNKNFILLLVLSGVIYSANSWNTSVYVLDEAKNAGCAMEMYQRNGWVVPTFNNEIRTDKPPLHYYHMMLAFKAFGITPFAARFFSIVMGIFTVLTVYFFARVLANEKTAFYSALMLVSSIQLAVQFHLAVPDPYLIFFLTFGWLSFIFAYQKNQPLFYYLFYFSIGLATLAKGPVAILFTGLVVLIFLFTQKKFSFRTLAEIKVLPGTLIFAAIVLPWFILVGVETNGQWLEQFFFKHNINRFTSTMEGHGGFPLASFVIVIGALMPFSFFFPQAIRKVWHVSKTNAFMQFCLIAFIVVVVFFAFSRTILPSYPEPSLPFLAIMLGYFINIVESTPRLIRDEWLLINAIVYAVVALLIPFAAWFGLEGEESLRDLNYLAYYSIILPIGAILGLYLMAQKGVVQAIWSYSLSMVVFLLCLFYILFPKADKRNPVSQSLPLFTVNAKPILYYKDFNPAFVFALRHGISELKSLDSVPHHSAIGSGYYLITQKRFVTELDTLHAKVIFEGKDLFEHQRTVVMEK